MAVTRTEPGLEIQVVYTIFDDEVAPEVEIRPVKRATTLRGEKDFAKKAAANGAVDSELSDEEYDADENEDEGDWVKPKFDAIIGRIRSKELDLKTEAKREAFLRQYGDFLNKRTREWRRNLLHTLAYEVSNRELVKLLITRHPALLEEKDTDNKTPVYVAIMRKRTLMLKAMFAAAKNLGADQMDRILAMTDASRNNCIHAVILQGIPPDVAIRVIARAKEATLCARDMKGRTPLHLAVEYDRCNGAQLEVVRELLARGDKALDEVTEMPDRHSAYEYHDYTKALFQKAATASKEAAVSPREVAGPGDGLPRAKTGPPPPPPPTQQPPQPPQKQQQLPQDLPSRQLANTKHEANTSHGSGRGQNKVSAKDPFSDYRLGSNDPGSATDRRGSVMEGSVGAEEPGPWMTYESGRALPTAAQKAKEAEVDKDKEADPVTEATANAIRDELRLHFLRTTFTTRDNDRAVRFLLGKNNKAIQTYFDFSKPPDSISEADFKDSFEHLDFYDVLEYVSFSPVELERPPIKENSRFARRIAEQQQRGGRGRSEMLFFFRWLQRDKKVRQILKVTVADDSERPHSDEVIEDALGPFNVEILDWGKLDLCPAVIVKACPNLRELHLHWGGNNTVLRAWSEPEGLPQLRRLIGVHLHLNQTLESTARIEANIKEFERRLTKDRPEVKVYRYIVDDGKVERLVTPNQPGAAANNSSRNLLPHRWLECMDGFASQIQSVNAPETRIDDLKEPITVALIDDGVDLCLPALRGKIWSGTSFDHDGPYENRPVPYYVTSTGHGTIMATMICRVCPVTRLHVYKLETTTTAETGPQMTAKSAAQAIEAAVARKVDIISMSWTIRETADNARDIKDLEAALERAYEANILMFCSASDKGAHPETDYPAYNPKRVFRIGAATADGRAWALAGDLHNLDFVVPGHMVLDRSGSVSGGAGMSAYGPLLENFQPRTGSSVATALAAGLGALVLHCVRLAAMHAEETRRAAGGKASATDVTVREFLGLKKHDVMKAALKNIGTSDEGRHKFIEVWQRFDAATEELRLAATRDEKMAVVAKLASGLLPAMGTAK